MRELHDLDVLAERVGPTVRIGIGNGCAEPRALIDLLVQHPPRFEHVEIYGMIHFSSMELMRFVEENRFKLSSFMVDKHTARGLSTGCVDYIPCRYSRIPELFRRRILPVDVALVSLTPPDKDGTCSFGVSSDFTTAMARSATLVVAELNPRMPRVGGDNFIHVHEVDYGLESDRALPQAPRPEIRPVDLEIGRNVAGLIEDEATIQVGIGRLSEAVLSCLGDRRRLGFHSGLMTDGFVDLIRKGVADNSRKGFKEGKTVTSTMLGTDKLFAFVHRNDEVEAFPSDFTHHQAVLQKVKNLHAVNSAIQVDLTGQVNAETIQGLQVSGVGGQTDFICGAALSQGGKSIVALPSCSGDGRRSKIVPSLDPGSAVTSLRHDVDYVVTEYGVASLKGKSLRSRARALIEIAHPRFRESLEIAGL